MSDRRHAHNAAAVAPRFRFTRKRALRLVGPAKCALCAVCVAFAIGLALSMCIAPDAASADEPSSSSAAASSGNSASSSAASNSGKSAGAEDADDDNDDAPSPNPDGDDEDALVDTEPKSENLVDPTQRADNSFIYDTEIEDLFDQASLHEGNTVQVIGEVVGDLIQADDYTGGSRELYWVVLTSMNVENSSNISVLMTADQAKQIDHFGRYGVTGTTLQVRGVYHQACSEHQGLPDIHATNATVVARGVEKPDSFRMRRFVPGFLMIFIGAVMLGIYYFARERSR